MRWVRDFRSPALLTATSETEGFPASRVVDRTRPFRAWRSIGTAQQDLVLDLGSSLSFAAVALYGANFSSVQLAHSLDNATYVDFAGSPFTVAEDPKDQRRKLIVVSSQTRRYIRVRIPAQTPDGGAAYFSLGTVFVAQALRSIPEQGGPWVPLAIAPARPLAAVDVGGRVEAVALGERYLDQSWRTNAEEANVAELMRIGLLDASDAPILVEWERGQASEIYYVRPAGGTRIDHGGVTVQVSLGLRQVT